MQLFYRKIQIINEPQFKAGHLILVSTNKLSFTTISKHLEMSKNRSMLIQLKSK